MDNPQPNTHKPRSGLKRLLWLAGIACVVLACILQAELLLLPLPLEGVGRIVYRIVFFIVLPFRALVAVAIPRMHHHWSLAHHVVTGLGAPFFYWGCYRFFTRRSRKKRRTHAATEAARIPRRQFLARSAAGAGALAIGGTCGYAALIAPYRLEVRTYEVPIPGLPRAFDGLRIVHVADTHYGPYNSLSFIQNAADLANALEPDLVAFTGDYVHFTPRSIEHGIGVLAKFHGRLGAVAVLGNHEHYEGADACRRVFQRIGVPLVDNAHLFLTPRGLTKAPAPGESLCLAGVGDYKQDEVSFDDALDGVPDHVPRLVLSHNPDAAELVKPGQRVDLMLCGHTHGGQIKLPVLGAPWVSSEHGGKYLGGMCQGPQCPVLVTRGVGTAYFPARFGVPPEFGVITLRAKTGSRGRSPHR